MFRFISGHRDAKSFSTLNVSSFMSKHTEAKNLPVGHKEVENLLAEIQFLAVYLGTQRLKAFKQLNF